MVQDFLKMFIEVLNCITIIVRGRGVGLYNCDVNGLALRRMVIRLLQSGRQLMTVFTMPLWTRNPTPCSCLSSLPLKYNLRPPWVDILPKFFHRTSQRPKMFQRYLVVSYAYSSNLHAIPKVPRFQVPIMILFLASTLLVVTPVAYFSPPSWCAAEGAVLVDPGDDRSRLWNRCHFMWRIWFGFEFFLLLDGFRTKAK